jgi:phospholipase/lecithinase/hemolysin
MYVFGDSYSDIGEGYLDGNGPTAVAYLAERLGFKLYPSNTADVRGKSLDYAVSGANWREVRSGWEVSYSLPLTRSYS